MTPSQQIELLEAGDMHWYKKGTGAWLPSVSSILGLLKDGLEFVSPYELKKAQERGVKIHKATELLEAGQTLEKVYYTDQEWDMLGGFINWHHAVNPKLLGSEMAMADKKLGYAGTYDRTYLIDDKFVLVDIKTTSAIQDKHWLQVAAYAHLMEKTGGGDIFDSVAILRLTDKSKTKYQYEERTREEWQKDLKAFNHVLATWKYLNGDKQPKISELPDTLTL